MTINGKQLDLPAIPELSFYSLAEQARKEVKSDDVVEKTWANQVLEVIKQYPELETGITDSSQFEKLREPIELLSRWLFPKILEKNEIKLLTAPFDFNALYSSSRFSGILETADIDFKEFMDEMPPDQHYIMQSSFILASYYGWNIQSAPPMVLEVKNKKNDTSRNYRLAVNADMVKFSPAADAPEVTRGDFERLLDNYDDIDLWKSMFPPNSWSMKGVFMINMMDITLDSAISSIKSNLLNLDEESMERVPRDFQRLFETPDLEVGMISFDDDVLSAIPKKNIESLALPSGMEIDCKSVPNDPVIKKVLDELKPLAISNVDKISEQLDKTVFESLQKTKYKSYLIAPLQSEEEIFGFIEFASTEPYALNTGSLNRLNEVLPMLSMVTKRFHIEKANQIEAIIQQECTTIHHSVKWRFEQEAKSFLMKQMSGENAAFSDLIFPDVIPLYGQLDIKSSSRTRNKAVQHDLLKQIDAASVVLKAAIEATSMPAYEALLFQLNKNKEELRDGLRAESEHDMVDFFQYELHPVFEHFKEGHKSLIKVVDTYFSKLDSQLKTIYEERKKFDNNVNLLNQKLASYLDQQQVQAQRMFPHYFERYKTDGVEFNMYIGQSMAKNGTYDPIHLQNLRLWQIQTMVEMERLYSSMRHELDITLEIASLILIFNSPLSVHFRMDEKRFDVEGAYNARYEIIKKRIDKAHIKGTKERLTQPGYIAMVYSNSQDALEYNKHLAFLQSKGYLEEEVEQVQLEDLQGISGLKALRVKVVYEKNPLSDVGVDDLIKTISTEKD